MPPPLAAGRVAIVHDWLSARGGAERVLERLLGLFPEADLYTVVDFLPAGERDWLQGRPVRTSFLQRLPGAARRYRSLLALMPAAIARWDLSGYDLVVSSSHSVAKNVTTGTHQRHLCYIHTPMRYAWDLRDHYLQLAGFAGPKAWLARLVLERLRRWDLAGARRVDRFVANSQFVAERVRRCYGREAAVVHPPVDLERLSLSESAEPFFLTVSRMVPYKRIDLIAEAFRQLPDQRLVIVGDGPEMDRVRRAAGDNVTLMGRQPDAVVSDLLRRCRAFLFAAIEDFGIAPLEAQACGKPVIALGRGGALETLRGLDHDRPSAVFFAEQTPADLAAAVGRFLDCHQRLTPAHCRANAERFSPAAFDAGIRAQVADLIGMPSAGRAAQD